MRLQTIALLAALLSLALISSAQAQAQTSLDKATVTVEQQSRNYTGSRENRIAWAIFHWVNRTARSETATRIADPSKLADLNDAIKLRAGSCGTATALSLELADRLGIQARPVEFYYTENGAAGSHIMPEFKVDGHWQLMDVLFHTVYRSPITHRVLSAREVTAMPYKSAVRRQQRFPDIGRELYTRGAAPWKAPHNPYRYLADPASQMTIDDHGTITWPAHASVANIPNYIGQAASFGSRRANLSARFTGLTASHVTVRFTSGSAHGRIVARSGILSAATVGSSSTSVTLPVVGPNVVLSVEGGGYVVVQGIDG